MKSEIVLKNIKDKLCREGYSNNMYRHPREEMKIQQWICEEYRKNLDWLRDGYLNSAWVLLGDNRVFCSGGSNY